MAVREKLIEASGIAKTLENNIATAIRRAGGMNHISRRATIVRICVNEAVALLSAQRTEFERALKDERKRCIEIALHHKAKITVNEPLWHDGQDWAAQRIADAIRTLSAPTLSSDRPDAE